MIGSTYFAATAARFGARKSSDHLDERALAKLDKIKDGTETNPGIAFGRHGGLTFTAPRPHTTTQVTYTCTVNAEGKVSHTTINGAASGNNVAAFALNKLLIGQGNPKD